MIDTNKTKELHKRGCTAIDVFALCDEIDRLRAAKPQGKTVRVEAFYAVDKDGYYRILGICGDSVAQADLRVEVCNDAAFDDGPVAFGKITANLPIPEETTVKAEVENGNN